MKRMGLFKTVSLLLGCLTMFSCVDYDDIQPFTGKTLPRKSGYSTGVTNDWIYFNLRTGESFNTYTVNKDIKEGEQINRTDWDLAFCGYTMRTNSGTSGIGQGGAADLGYGGYDDWTSVSQLPSDLEWVVDTDDVRVTMSQNDWNHYLVENNLDFDANPWFDPNNGPATTVAGHELLRASPHIHPFVPHVCGAYRRRREVLQDTDYQLVRCQRGNR